MPASIFPIGLLIAGGVAYHLGQKAAGGGSVWRVLVVAYGAAFAASSLMWLLAPGTGGRAPQRGELLAAVTIGLAALAIEAGFFLAYRAGWSVGTTSLMSTVVVSAILATFGVLVFGESITLARAGGVALAMLGAIFIVRG